jgi:dipeptidyl aminopeptidase/acylaminoacyl peptidase
MNLRPSDFLALVGVEDPQISPDARSILYVRARLNLEKNRTERAIWRIRKDVSEAFTQGIADSAPRWSTDGRHIAFLRSDPEKKTTSLFVMSADGGEPREIAGPFARIGPAAWSPDCKRVAFSAAVAVAPAQTSVAFDEVSGARHVIALPYKSDSDGLSDGKRSQVHVATLEGEVRIVAGGAFDAGTPAWSPNGRSLVFVANPGTAEDSFANAVCAVAAEGGELRRLTTHTKASFDTPAFSRDGREIAVIVDEDENFFGRRNAQLWCIAAEGGTPRSLTPDRRFALGDAVIGDLRVHGNAPPFWMPDDEEIVIQRSHEGACTLVAYERDGSSSREIAGGELEMFAFSGARDGTLAFASTDVGDPGSIAILRRDGSMQRLANENAQWLADHPPIPPERIRPKAADGTQLDAWLLRSPGAGGPAPLVHAIHGGPHAAYGFAYFFEFQLLASLGMHVVYGNPRGSQTYGESYADAITGRFGDLDASDLLAILHAAKEQLSVDARRIAVQGGSYGGLMTTWLLGHTKEYACGVSMRAVNDYVSEATVSDIHRFILLLIGADFSDGGKRLFDSSPIRAAENVDAPLLIMHSDRDFRCPIDQGEQLFGRLRALGKTAEYVRFTGDGHDLSRNGSPRNRLLRYRALCHWLRRYLALEEMKEGAGAGWLFEPIDGELSNAN